MERMLVAVFDTEKQAYEGLRGLSKLDVEGSIAIYAEAVIQKNADGTVATKQVEEDFPIRTLGGTALGSLIGLLAGPVGLAFGRRQASWPESSGTYMWRELTPTSFTMFPWRSCPGNSLSLRTSMRSGSLPWTAR